MNPLFARPLAIVDLETTGADPNRDRITEVAIIRIENGQEVDAWSSLIDPEMPIPQRIQAFTGITNEMVAHAPNFRALAESIAARLEGAVFVAHNARFDFNFLRAAFAERNLRFDPAVLCTVKFSRALFPEHARHGLDAIVDREGYAVTDRHRAMTDAVIVWRYLQKCAAHFDAATLTRALDRAGSPATGIPTMPVGDLEALPEAPGVYVFLNGAGGVVQMGRTQHLRSKVLGVFTGSKDARTVKLATQVKRVEVEVAAGDLDAHLIELRLARVFDVDKQPERALGWRWLKGATSLPVLEAVELSGSDPGDWDNVFGLFRGPREAENTLRELVRLHRLCPQRTGLEHSEGACQAYGLRRCNGVCVGEESPAQHDLRLCAALAPLRPKAWPWPGPIAVSEWHEPSDRAAVHLFNRWCYLGRARDPESASRMLAANNGLRFNLEIFRLLARWLSQSGNMDRVTVIGAADSPVWRTGDWRAN